MCIRDSALGGPGPQGVALFAEGEGLPARQAGAAPYDGGGEAVDGPEVEAVGVFVPEKSAEAGLHVPAGADEMCIRDQPPSRPSGRSRC